MTIQLKEIEKVKTPRRNSWAAYARFLLNRADVEPSEAESFLNEKQEKLFGYSPLELIYTGRYELGVSAVEVFTESLNLEDL